MTDVDPRSLACLETLIGFDTTSRNSNLACIDWARAHLEAHGAVTRTDWNADRTKANLFATFGEDRGQGGGVVLSGHVDVVPVDGQAWSSDPFTTSIRDGRLYGRGACDMKGFDAVVLGHAADYAAASLRQPIHIALTYDEELGCLGIPHLIAALRKWDIHPSGCIVGEPTSMQLVEAHKGGRLYRCRVIGQAAHSSLTPTAVNAIEYAAVLIAAIRGIAIRERTSGPRDEGFDVPHTSISTNMISGGNGANIVPESAEFLFDYRLMPGADPEAIIGELQALAAELIPEMRRVAPEADILFEQLAGIPALASAEGSEIFAVAQNLIGNAPPGKVAYGTEAGSFSDYGVPTIVCGPGSIEQAHKADEYVALSQLAACDRFIEGLIARLSV
jgi:acetylornithine deacetylase